MENSINIEEILKMEKMLQANRQKTENAIMEAIMNIGCFLKGVEIAWKELKPDEQLTEEELSTLVGRKAAAIWTMLTKGEIINEIEELSEQIDALYDLIDLGILKRKPKE